jgi:hypothetical protein
MPSNVQPIYTKVGDIQWTPNMNSGNTTTDLTSGTSYLAFSADPTNGGYVQKIRFKPLNSGTTTATVARIWINNGSTTGTSSNNTFIDEISLPSVTGSVSASVPVYEIPLNIALPPGYTIYITLGTNTAIGYRATVFGGKY